MLLNPPPYPGAPESGEFNTQGGGGVNNATAGTLETLEHESFRRAKRAGKSVGIGAPKSLRSLRKRNHFRRAKRAGTILELGLQKP